VLLVLHDMSLSATALKLVMRQLQEIRSNPVEGLTLRDSQDIAVVEAELRGPEGTAYANGSFNIALILGDTFPEAPPKGYFKTKIFHPNVSDKGEICVNTLKKDWDSSLGIRHVLVVIRCLLIEPNPESALNEEAGRLLLEDYNSFAKKARMVTSVHAMPGGGVAPGGPLRDSDSTNQQTTAGGAATNAAGASQKEAERKKIAEKTKAALRRL